MHRQRRARIETGLRGQQHGHVLDRAAHRPFDRELLHEDLGRRPEGHHAGGRPQAVDIAEGGRVADRAAEVAAVGHRQHARRQRRGGTAAAAADRLGQVVGVDRGAVDRVDGVRAERELRHVGLADDDGAGALGALDDDRVFLRHVVLQERRARGGGDADGGGRVLDRVRQAVHPAQVFAAGELAVALGCLSQSPCRSCSETMALTFGLTRSICARYASITSTHETSLALMWRDNVSAVQPVTSVPGAGQGPFLLQADRSRSAPTPPRRPDAARKLRRSRPALAW